VVVPIVIVAVIPVVDSNLDALLSRRRGHDCYRCREGRRQEQRSDDAFCEMQSVLSKLWVSAVVWESRLPTVWTSANLTSAPYGTYPQLC
jgi:hypothetical protein